MNKLINTRAQMRRKIRAKPNIHAELRDANKKKINK